MNLRNAVTLGFVSIVASACAVEDNVSTTEQEIKANNKLFATARAPQHNVEVFDVDGVEQAPLTGQGITTPFGVDVQAHDVYVVSQGTGQVFAHQHKNGEADPSSLTLLVSGLTQAFYPKARGNTLYVSNGGKDEILTFNRKSGAPQGAFVTAGSGGVDQPRGIDFDSRGHLFVASHLTNQVLEYDGDGNFVKVFASVATPCGLAIDENDRVCVGSAPPGRDGLHCFDSDGVRFYHSGSNKVVCGLDWGPDGSVYAANTDPLLGAANMRVEIHDFVNPPVIFATVPNLAAVAWGGHD